MRENRTKRVETVRPDSGSKAFFNGENDQSRWIHHVTFGRHSSFEKLFEFGTSCGIERFRFANICADTAEHGPNLAKYLDALIEDCRPVVYRLPKKVS